MESKGESRTKPSEHSIKAIAGPKSNLLHMVGLRKNMPVKDKMRKHPVSNLKVFSKEWLNIDIMKDWLVQHSSPVKAKCRVCHKVLNAGKSELFRHASGRKHTLNLQKFMKSQAAKSQTQEALDYITNSLQVDLEPCDEDYRIEQSAGPTRVGGFDASTSNAENTNKGTEKKGQAQDAYQKEHIELLTRIASAVERIANSQEALVKLKSAKPQ